MREPATAPNKTTTNTLQIHDKNPTEIEGNQGGGICEDPPPVGEQNTNKTGTKIQGFFAANNEKRTANNRRTTENELREIDCQSGEEAGRIA